MTLRAWGIIISFKDRELFNPIDFAASFCPLLIDNIPALTFSAINADVCTKKAQKAKLKTLELI